MDEEQNTDPELVQAAVDGYRALWDEKGWHDDYDFNDVGLDGVTSVDEVHERITQYQIDAGGRDHAGSDGEAAVNNAVNDVVNERIERPSRVERIIDDWVGGTDVRGHNVGQVADGIVNDDRLSKEEQDRALAQVIGSLNREIEGSFQSIGQRTLLEAIGQERFDELASGADVTNFFDTVPGSVNAQGETREEAGNNTDEPVAGVVQASPDAVEVDPNTDPALVQAAVDGYRALWDEKGWHDDYDFNDVGLDGVTSVDEVHERITQYQIDAGGRDHAGSQGEAAVNNAVYQAMQTSDPEVRLAIDAAVEYLEDRNRQYNDIVNAGVELNAYVPSKEFIASLNQAESAQEVADMFAEYYKGHGHLEYDPDSPLYDVILGSTNLASGASPEVQLAIDAGLGYLKDRNNAHNDIVGLPVDINLYIPSAEFIATLSSADSPEEVAEMFAQYYKDHDDIEYNPDSPLYDIIRNSGDVGPDGGNIIPPDAVQTQEDVVALRSDSEVVNAAIDAAEQHWLARGWGQEEFDALNLGNAESVADVHEILNQHYIDTDSIDYDGTQIQRDIDIAASGVIAQTLEDNQNPPNPSVSGTSGDAMSLHVSDEVWDAVTKANEEAAKNGPPIDVAAIVAQANARTDTVDLGGQEVTGDAIADALRAAGLDPNGNPLPSSGGGGGGGRGSVAPPPDPVLTVRPSSIPEGVGLGTKEDFYMAGLDQSHGPITNATPASTPPTADNPALTEEARIYNQIYGTKLSAVSLDGSSDTTTGEHVNPIGQLLKLHAQATARPGSVEPSSLLGKLDAVIAKEGREVVEAIGSIGPAANFGNTGAKSTGPAPDIAPGVTAHSNLTKAQLDVLYGSSIGKTADGKDIPFAQPEAINDYHAAHNPPAGGGSSGGGGGGYVASTEPPATAGGNWGNLTPGTSDYTSAINDIFRNNP